MNRFYNKRIFLDYASATPVLPEVRQAMEKYWSKDFYNPSAIYIEGVQVKKEVEKFRTKIARLIGVSSDSIIFTSGGTEANTWAIRGLKNSHIIIDAMSHPSVFEAAVRDREVERERLISLSTMFIKNIQHSLPEVYITQDSPNIINLSVPGIPPELLLLALDRAGVLVSAGPACNSNKPEPPDTPVRFSFGRFTTTADVKQAVEIFCRVAESMVKWSREFGINSIHAAI